MIYATAPNTKSTKHRKPKIYKNRLTFKIHTLVPDLLVKFYFMIKKNNIFIDIITIKILVK